MVRSPKNVLGAAIRLAPVVARDLTGLGGLSAIIYGAWAIYHPAGYIVGGLFAVTAAVLVTMLDQKTGA